MQDQNFTDAQLLDRLLLGLERDYIAPWFQPVMDPAGVNMMSAEALPRFIDPEYGVISPMTFIDVAARNDLLAPIGEVLLTKTCKAYKEWSDRSIAPELVTINLSGDELRTPGVVERIEGALREAGIKPHNLGIEVGESVSNPRKYYTNNVLNTLNLVHAMMDHGLNYLIFSSTAAVYGTPDYTPVDEDHPRRPINPYGQSKHIVETVLEDYRDSHGFSSTSLRYFNAAGADPDGELGERHEPESHLVPLVIQAALGRRPDIKIYGTD